MVLPLILLGLASPAMAELQGRMETSPGSGDYDAYYDTELDNTWTRDSNLSGQCWWFLDANAWVAGLMFHGTVGWRLPSPDTDGDGVEITSTCPSAESRLDNEFS